MAEILQKENLILREKAEPVPVSEIGSERVQRVIRAMKEAMRGEKDAVAIAAPQIGEPLRIFVVSGPALAREQQEENPDAVEDMVFINPEIVSTSREKEWIEEGCLSCRWLYGKTERARKATVRAYDENGQLFTRGASGLLAQIFQHETEHLDGILFIDHARDIYEQLPQSDRK